MDGGHRPAADHGSGPPGPGAVSLRPDGGVRGADGVRWVQPAVGRQLLCGVLPEAVRRICPGVHPGGAGSGDGILRTAAGGLRRSGAAGRKRPVCREPGRHLCRQRAGVRRRVRRVPLPADGGPGAQGGAVFHGPQRHGLYGVLFPLYRRGQPEHRQPRLLSAQHHCPRDGPPAGHCLGAGVQLHCHRRLHHGGQHCLSLLRLAHGLYLSLQRPVPGGSGGVAGRAGAAARHGGGGPAG